MPDDMLAEVYDGAEWVALAALRAAASDDSQCLRWYRKET